MKSVGSYEAKTHLPRLLSQVEKGETITITKRGKPIAVLSPAQAVAEQDVPPLSPSSGPTARSRPASTALSRPVKSRR